MDAAYDDQVYVDDRTIDSHVKRVRKKFREVDSTSQRLRHFTGLGIGSGIGRQEAAGVAADHSLP